MAPGALSQTAQRTQTVIIIVQNLFYGTHETCVWTKNASKTTRRVAATNTVLKNSCHLKGLRKGCSAWGWIQTLFFLWHALVKSRHAKEPFVCKAPIKNGGSCMRARILNWFEYRTIYIRRSSAAIGRWFAYGLAQWGPRRFFKVSFYNGGVWFANTVYVMYLNVCKYYQ